jgi:hypothetical protein
MIACDLRVVYSSVMVLVADTFLAKLLLYLFQ